MNTVFFIITVIFIIIIVLENLKHKREIKDISREFQEDIFDNYISKDKFETALKSIENLENENKELNLKIRKIEIRTNERRTNERRN
jgi:sensor histidine kinase YesM